MAGISEVWSESLTELKGTGAKLGFVLVLVIIFLIFSSIMKGCS